MGETDRPAERTAIVVADAGPGAALGASVGDDARRTLERSIESVGPGTKLATLGRGLLAIERTRDSLFDRARTAAAVAVVDGAERLTARVPVA